MMFWRKKANEEESEKKESIKDEYFEVERPSGDGRCSDDLCPCGQPGVIIPRGTGYLYIPQQVVDFRRDARSLKACREKMHKIQKKWEAFTFGDMALILRLWAASKRLL